MELSVCVSSNDQELDLSQTVSCFSDTTSIFYNGSNKWAPATDQNDTGVLAVVTGTGWSESLSSLNFAHASQELNIIKLSSVTIKNGTDGGVKAKVEAEGAAIVSKTDSGLKFDINGGRTVNFTTLTGIVDVYSGSTPLLQHTSDGYKVFAETGGDVTVNDPTIFSASNSNSDLKTLKVSSISDTYGVTNENGKNYVTIGTVKFRLEDNSANYITLADSAGSSKTYYVSGNQLIAATTSEPEGDSSGGDASGSGTGDTDDASDSDTDDTSTTDATTTENDASQSVSKASDVENINAAFARVDANATADTIKQLTVGSSEWNSTIEMGDKGKSVVVFEAGSTSSGVIDKGKNAGVLVFTDKNANLSNVTILNYDSTKDTLATTKSLSDYLTKQSNGATSNFIKQSTGKYGTDLMSNSGLLAATKKSGFYQTKYSELDANNGEVGNEVLVVGGSSTAARGDFSGSDIAIFGMTDNNDVSDTIKGSANNDRFVAGVGDSINGGAGDDSIRSYGSIIQLATSGEGNDIINNWGEYNANSATNSTLNLNASKNIKDLELSRFTIIDGKVVVKLDDGSTNAGATITTTKNSSDTFKIKIKAANNSASSAGLLANIGETEGATDTNALQNATAKSEDKEYAALLVNTGAYGGVIIDNNDANLDAYYGVEGKNYQVSFGSSKKTNIFFGASGNGEEWGDNAVYSDITNVKTSDIGASLLINGTGNNATLEAGGANDSLWGGIGGSNDLLVSNKNNRTYFAAGYDNGRDTIEGFKYGLDAKGENQAVDVVYFLDGASYLSVEGGSFIAGTSEENNIKLIGEGTKDITFAYELGKELSTARVDMTNGGSTNIEYDGNAEWYIGQGEASAVNFGENAVQFAYNSKYASLNIGTLNATNTKDGSLINGSNDLNQTVIASGVGASSVCGGFYGNFENGNNDTLIGGGDGNETFYVGKNMGSDVVTNAADGDSIVFLATKVSDITGLSNASEGFNVNFNGTDIAVKLADGKSMADMKNLTAKFDDGEYVYNGFDWVLKS